MTTEPVLAIEGLRKSFGSVTAVRDLTLAVLPGEVFGLLGPNGAGKTTTIRMICGEIRPDQGRILLRGKPLSDTPDGRSRVGLCPQEIVVWEKLTCREQLEFVGSMYGLPRAAARDRTTRLLTDLGLAAKAEARGAALSGGQRRRLNIALAVVHEPELVVLDEPGAGLDPQSRALVREVIRSLARTSAVILTTHDMDEAERLSDRVAIIDRGDLLICGSPGAVRSTLDGEMIELRFVGNGQDGVGEALRSIPGLTLHDSPGLVGIRAERAAAVLPAVLSALDQRGITPDELRLRRPSLEDVFLHLTGRSLRS